MPDVVVVGGLPQQRDLGAHHGEIAPVQLQQCQSGVVAVVFQVIGQQPVRLGTVTPGLQVHGEKRDPGNAVHDAQGGIELDTVKQPHPPVHQGDIAQVGITVAVDHLPLRHPAFQQWPQPVPASDGPLLHYRELFILPGREAVGAQLAEILLDGRQQARGRAGLVAARPGPAAGRPAVLEREFPRQGTHQRALQFTAGGDTVEQPRLVEAAHLYRVVDDGSAAAETRPGAVIVYGNHGEVQFRCEALVQ